MEGERRAWNIGGSGEEVRNEMKGERLASRRGREREKLSLEIQSCELVERVELLRPFTSSAYHQKLLSLLPRLSSTLDSAPSTREWIPT